MTVWLLVLVIVVTIPGPPDLGVLVFNAADVGACEEARQRVLAVPDLVANATCTSVIVEVRQ